VIRARKSVVSNASVWDTQRLLPTGTAPPEWAKAASETPAIESFMHLHLGIDATGLPEDLECHHVIINDWEALDSPQNVSIVSIPTVFDPSLAPEGKAVVHAYTAANEPWEIWEGVQRGTKAYRELKQERARALWKALERVRSLYQPYGCRRGGCRFSVVVWWMVGLATTLRAWRPSVRLCLCSVNAIEFNR
jgi:phytoene dehydrogenase-like protein